jgi:hypothetical protein
VQFELAENNPMNILVFVTIPAQAQSYRNAILANTRSVVYD